MWKESSVEKQIIENLSFYEGFVKKIHRGGRPIKKGNSIVMIPFKEEEKDGSPPDLYFIKESKNFWFEVKHPSIIKRLYRLLNTDDLPNLNPLVYKFKRSNLSTFRQLIFMRKATSQGALCGFVSSLDGVIHMIKNQYTFPSEAIFFEKQGNIKACNLWELC